MKRWIAAGLVGLAVAGAAWWRAQAPGVPAREPAPVAARPAPSVAAPATDTPPPPAAAPLAPPAEEAQQRARLLEHETVQQRLARLALEEEARTRFDQSLADSGISPAEIEEGVKRVFETMEVEPVLLRGGRMEGMILRELPPGHPFARAGFADGDRLVRLDGWELDDAARLPEVFIRLQRTFTACALRDGRELCRAVEVDAAS